MLVCFACSLSESQVKLFCFQAKWTLVCCFYKYQETKVSAVVLFSPR